MCRALTIGHRRSSCPWGPSIVVAFLIAGCSGSDGAPNSSGYPPSLDVTALEFEALFAGPLPNSKHVLVQSPGDVLEVATSDPATWLRAEAADSPLGAGVDFSVTETNLPDDEYRTTVRFTAY